MAKKKATPTTTAENDANTAATTQAIPSDEQTPAPTPAPKPEPAPDTNAVPAGSASVAGSSSDDLDATRDTLREFRVHLDSNAAEIHELQYQWRASPHSGSITKKGRNISSHIDHAIDSVLFAKAWIGKVMQARGYQNPYGSGMESVDDIEPTADTYGQSDLANTRKRPSYVGQISDMRDRLNYSLSLFAKLEPNRPATKEEARAWTNAYTHLVEAKLHLGFELARIKQESGE